LIFNELYFKFEILLATSIQIMQTNHQNRLCLLPS